jgi:hypothetical protein
MDLNDFSGISLVEGGKTINFSNSEIFEMRYIVFHVGRLSRIKSRF